MSCREACIVSRRAFLGSGAASLALWSLMPRTALAGTRDPRLLVVVLRGGLDGLAAVAPVGDPDYARLRGDIALPTSGEGAGLPLDGFFMLNGAMPQLHSLYRSGEALVVHAVHTPYRARSHFDGQDVLESGLPGVGKMEDGWLNRALAQSAQRREGQSAGACPRRRGAARHARPGPGAILDTEGLRRAPARIHDCAAHGSLRRDRSGAGARVCRGHGDPPRRRRRPQHTGRAACTGTNTRRAAQSPVHRGRRSRSQVPVHRRRAAHRRAELRRLGHACQRRPRERSARASSRQPRRRHRGIENRHGSGMAGHRLPSSSPSSAAPRASTARKAPTMAWPRSR